MKDLKEYPIECRACEYHTEDGIKCAVGQGCKLRLCFNVGYVYTAFPRKKMI